MPTETASKHPDVGINGESKSPPWDTGESKGHNHDDGGHSRDWASDTPRTRTGTPRQQLTAACMELQEATEQAVGMKATGDLDGAMAILPEVKRLREEVAMLKARIVTGVSAPGEAPPQQQRVAR